MVFLFKICNKFFFFRVIYAIVENIFTRTFVADHIVHLVIINKLFLLFKPFYAGYIIGFKNQYLLVNLVAPVCYFFFDGMIINILFYFEDKEIPSRSCKESQKNYNRNNFFQGWVFRSAQI